MTTRIYCTLFDKNYLYQGVALHRSLLRYAGKFTLYALCMDSTAHAMIERMRSPSLVPIDVNDLITDEVARVRERTTHGQFCWVCQPLVCEYILDRFAVDMVTYLESDSLFFSDPEALFSEIADRSASLVPHNFSSEFDNSSTAGLYCVQFNAFRNNAAGRRVLGYWRQRSFEYDRRAPLVYPGQLCLDDWPGKFEGVAVISHRGAGVAPWNVRGYSLGMRGSTPTVDGVPVVFYHYHQYARRRGGEHDLGSYPMTQQVVESFYKPYVAEIRLAEQATRAIDAGFNYRRECAQISTLAELLRAPSVANAAEYARLVGRKLRGRYNVYSDAYFPA
jgi:hypothetical protein